MVHKLRIECFSLFQRKSGSYGFNYTPHAIASVVDCIRRDHRLMAMVTANGWFNSKHAIGV